MGRLSVPIGLLALLAGCSGGPPHRVTPRAAAVNHPVFAKLNDPADAPELIADCDRLLATIPGVISYYCGTPLDTGRENIDLDFDVGLYLGFADESAYAAYVTHPNHVEVLTKWKPRLEWIRIYDVADRTP